MKISSYTKYLRLRVINTGVQWVVAALVVLLLMEANPVLAQNAVMKPSRAEAQAAWDRGDYEKAYTHFNGLLLLYTRDPLYQFYTGASLVKLERDIQRSVTLLSSAINSSVNIKSVPDEVWFYYGRALQMSGSFSQSIDAYERFSKQAGKKVAAGYEVQTFINQCSTGDGAVKPAVTSLPVTRKEAEVKDMVPVVTEKPVMTGNAGTEKESVTVRPDNEGAGVAGKKTEAVSVKPEQKIAEAAVPVTGRGTVPVVRGDTTGIPAEQFRILGEALEHPEQADSLLLALEGNRETNEEAKSLLPEPVKETGQVSLFEMKAGQAYTEASPVQIDPAMPEGLIYTIQIAAFRNNVAPSLFRGLYPVYGKRRQGSEAVYYYTGLFRRPDDARHALPEARGAGFSDAFIIAMMDGTQVSMERAALLEKEWGARPLTGTSLLPALKSSGGSGTGNQTSATAAAGGNTTPANQADTGQPVPVVTLSFRAEVMRISKPVKPEVIQKIELLAGTRGLDMIKNSNGETVFLIGNFITFESADDYVSLLIRNGYSDARVAAWVGMQEIPVEAARELLKKMPDD